MLDQLESLGASADFLCDAVQLVVENVAKSLRKYQWKDEPLYLGASLAPRIEHAPAQIHDSSDLSLFSLPAINHLKGYC
jgi:hypothetical protein